MFAHSSRDCCPPATTALSTATISATSVSRPCVAPCPTSSAIVTSRCALTSGTTRASSSDLKAPSAAAMPALSSRCRLFTYPAG
jgi:hypothetical protein